MTHKQTDKEMVIAYITTLPDKYMKDIYQILTERYDIHKAKYLLFNREGVQAKAPEGKVRLRPYQVERLIKGYGEQGFHRLIEIFWDYLDYLEKNTECVVRGKQKLKELSVISHYNILGKGWVAEKFVRENPQFSYHEEPDEEYIDFFDIDSKGKAIKYIRQTPIELRFDNQEIIYLVDKYNIDINNEV
jgi:hypothetical protein